MNSEGGGMVLRSGRVVPYIDQRRGRARDPGNPMWWHLIHGMLPLAGQQLAQVLFGNPAREPGEGDDPEGEGDDEEFGIPVQRAVRTMEAIAASRTITQTKRKRAITSRRRGLDAGYMFAGRAPTVGEYYRGITKV